ncbi:MAG TPA: tetratricopeptide repeat protein [Polyangia bacterium]|nr:tetratricopeptide repeat protein [Polyangia bacterium]
MSKSAKPAIIVLTAGVIALSALLILFALREKRSMPASIETQEPSVVATPPAPREPAAKTPPPVPAAPATGPRPRMATEPDAYKHLDETALMTKLHDLAASDPPLSLRLAREALDRFPDSPNAPEFNWNLVKALFNMGRLEEAREEARVMVAKYPGNYFAGDVDHHLLNHPPNPTDIPNP